MYAMLKKLDPVIWKVKRAHDEMSDYDRVNGSIAEAASATVSEWTKKNLKEADDKKKLAQNNLYTSYRWLSSSARLLYKLLKRVELGVKMRDRRENKLEKYFDKV